MVHVFADRSHNLYLMGPAHSQLPIAPTPKRFPRCRYRMCQD